jgi:heterodisulfide reductase subunit A
MSSDPVMIIGGGIAGIQAALDLADAGCHVVIVESSPSIGGKMAALDKNFPTLDCSICIEAPKISEVGENKNIKIFNNSDIVSIKREPNGSFLVKIKRKHGLVTSGCTRCNECFNVCPVVIPNEFDASMVARRAIYTPFPQAVPGPYVIDLEHCLNKPPIFLPCMRCYEVCPPKVIDFDIFRDEEHEIKASSIILSTGFELVDALTLPEYGYGTHPDILTSMEFERLLSSAGPTGGEILRPSDMHHPKNLVFILCAGSRSKDSKEFCSRFCCMYSIKEAIQALDHGVKDISVLYMDLRSYGKGFDKFAKRAKDEGVKFVRGRGAKIENRGGKVVIRYEDVVSGKLKELPAEMVVLALGVQPSTGVDALTTVLKVDLDEDGFIKGLNGTRGFIETNVPGIYAAGSAVGPKDIPDSVTEGCASAACAMLSISERSWEKEEVGEPLDSSGDPKIGVFVCDCGSNIAGTVNVPDVVKDAEKVAGVAHAQEVRFACAGNTQNEMAAIIKEKNLNRFVVAACSPKTHEGTFKRVCKKAGLNPYLLEMSNIRNHDSWVHKAEKDAATKKAKEMVRMAVEKARILTPLFMFEQEIVHSAIVVGGGAAGMSAASNLARQGYEVHLIERSDKLGGVLNELHTLAPQDINAQDLVKALSMETYASGVRVHLNCQIDMIDGYIGNFKARLTTGEEMACGVVIIATGAGLYVPKGFDYGKDPRVITNLELEHRLAFGKVEADKVTLVSCVGSRSGNRECSRYCCTSMVGQALRLRKMGKKVRVLFRDMRTYTRHGEELYREASEAGVAFFRYTDGNPEEKVSYSSGELRFFDETARSDVKMKTDLLVLMCGLTPAEENISKQLKVTHSEDGFLLEKHPKLGPVEAGSPGIFLVGTVQGPKDVRESISQGLAASAKASGILSKVKIEKEPLCAEIITEKCTGCGLCAKVCPFSAISIYQDEAGKKKAKVAKAACAGCGNCAATCYQKAIMMPYFTDDQILVQIDAALADSPETKTILFACNWCSYAGADQAGIEKIQYPPSARVIRTMCSARISETFIEHAFDKGAGAVLMTGCHIGDCHYINANNQTKERFEKWKKKYEKKGIEPERFQLHWVSAAEGKEFAAKVREMHEVVTRYAKNKGAKRPEGGE